MEKWLALEPGQDTHDMGLEPVEVPESEEVVTEQGPQ